MKKRIIPGFSYLFPSVSQQDLVVAQREDATLKEMFSAALSAEEVASAASGCFTEDEILLRKSGSEVPWW